MERRPVKHEPNVAELLLCVFLCVSVDPLVAAGNPASAVHRSLAAPGSVSGMPLAPVSPAVQSLAAAQQELLYRELLSRAPYVNDPTLTQQVVILVVKLCCIVTVVI